MSLILWDILKYNSKPLNIIEGASGAPVSIAEKAANLAAFLLVGNYESLKKMAKKTAANNLNQIIHDRRIESHSVSPRLQGLRETNQNSQKTRKKQAQWHCNFSTDFFES